jgi:riboflavin synthase
MFSGIVQRTGRIEALDWTDRCGRIAIRPEKDWPTPVEVGESVAVQGICLTVTESTGDRLYFDVLRETFERTNLGSKRVSDRLNLERSLRWGDTMGGHIVVGHVDGRGRVRRIDPVGRDWRFEFEAPADLLDGMVFKGSISIDGVSLTVAELTRETFAVHIIPFTYEETTFGALRPGDPVNLEVDLLGKFVRRLVERGVMPQQVTWEALRESGLITEVPRAES